MSNLLDHIKENTVDGVFFQTDQYFEKGIDADGVQDAVDDTARLLAQILKEAKREYYVNAITKRYKDIKVKVLKDAVKTAIDDKKEKEKKQRLTRDGIQLEFNMDEDLDLPMGVDEFQAMLFGVYEYKGKYYNPREKKEISNFTMRVLYHVKTGDDTAYKILELKSAIFNKSEVIRINTDDMCSLSAFRKIIARRHGFHFKGTDLDLIGISEKLSHDEQPTKFVKVLGYNKRGNFYAFANGIVDCNTDDYEFKEIDEYGIVVHQDESLFIPAMSKIFADKDDQFINDKKFMYMKSEITFKDWAAKFSRVYGKKGSAMIIFAVACIYRHHIYKSMQRRFPMAFLYGQRGSGKGTLMESLLHLFGVPQDQLMLGGESTSKGFMRKLAQYSNAMIWLDEYKNNIKKEKIESLKNIYDGIGYERAKSDNSFETTSTPISSGAVLSGQEMPVVEPALFGRCILLSFTPGKFNDDDRKAKMELNEIESKGISHLTVYLLQYAPVMEKAYKETYEKAFSDIITEVGNKEIDDRLYQNVACLVAVHRLLEANGCEFPFTARETQDFLIKNMIEQYEILAGSDDTAKWWQVVESLLSQHMIKEGTHFELKNGYLFIKIQEVHPLYQKELRSRNDPNVLDKSTLEHYLCMDTVKYVDKVRMRFTDGSNTQAYRFKYSELGIDLIKIQDVEELKAKFREMGLEYRDDSENSGDDKKKDDENEKTNDDLPF